MHENIINFARKTLKHILALNIQRNNLTKDFTRPSFRLAEYQQSLTYNVNACKLIRVQNSRKNLNYTQAPNYYNEILNLKMGDCAELTTVAYHFMERQLASYPEVSCVEFFVGVEEKPVFFDHAAILLNRPPHELSVNSFILNTLSAECLVVDPWLNCLFPAPHAAFYYEYMGSLYNWGNVHQLKVEVVSRIQQIRT